MPDTNQQILQQAADIEARASLGRVEFRLCQEHGNGREYYAATERVLYLGKDREAAAKLMAQLQLAVDGVTGHEKKRKGR